jgi:hypothetical protein
VGSLSISWLIDRGFDHTASNGRRVDSRLNWISGATELAAPYRGYNARCQEIPDLGTFGACRRSCPGGTSSGMGSAVVMVW